MKITKYGISEAEIRRAKANAGCDVCPRCGENKSDVDYVIESMESGKILLGCLIKEYCI